MWFVWGKLICKMWNGSVGGYGTLLIAGWCFLKFLLFLLMMNKIKNEGTR